MFINFVKKGYEKSNVAVQHFADLPNDDGQYEK